MFERLLAVYGTLRKGQGNDDYLAGAEFLGLRKTEPNFTLYHYGYFPFLYNQGNTAVTIEVYRITDEFMSNRIDRLEGFSEKGNPNNFYDCMEIPTQWGMADIFVCNEPKNLKIIQSGDWTLRNQL